MKKTRIHWQSIFFGCGLMVALGVLFSEIFYNILSFFTAVRFTFLGGGEKLSGHKVQEFTDSAVSTSSGRGLAGEVSYNDFEKSAKDVWLNYAKDLFESQFEDKFLALDNNHVHWRLFTSSIQSALYNYINWVSELVNSGKEEQYNKLSAADRLNFAVNLAMDSTNTFYFNMRTDILNSLRDKDFKNLLGEKSPLLTYRSAVSKGNYSAFNTYMKEFYKSAFLAVNKLYMKKGITLF